MESSFGSSSSMSRRRNRSGASSHGSRSRANWKLSPSDVRERERWDDYMNAYEDMIAHTATDYAPWYVVPADNKWFTRLVVAEVIVDTMEELNLEYPKVDAAQRKELKAA